MRHKKAIGSQVADYLLQISSHVIGLYTVHYCELILFIVIRFFTDLLIAFWIVWALHFGFYNFLILCIHNICFSCCHFFSIFSPKRVFSIIYWTNKIQASHIPYYRQHDVVYVFPWSYNLQIILYLHTPWAPFRHIGVIRFSTYWRILFLIINYYICTVWVIKRIHKAIMYIFI